MIAPRLRRGYFVRVRRAGTSDEWCPAMVALASDNGQSVGLVLNGAVSAAQGYITAFLPLTVDYEEETVKGIVTDDEYEIEVHK
jgi:hypothetical protein